MTQKRVVEIPDDPTAPYAWVRFTAAGFQCDRCQIARPFRSQRILDLRREGHDFLLRHKGCVERRLLQ